MLEVHASSRADALLRALGELLVTPLEDPFAAELVAVPTRGVERWITQQLSAVLGARDGRRDGVCANVTFPAPGRLIAEAAGAATGIDPDADPWRPERLVWAVLETVEGALDQAWLDPLARHFRGHRERRFSRARALARLFDEYGSYRPELIESWARGEGSHWQAELWRLVRDQLGVPSPAERLPALCARLREQPELLDLPPRLTVFGLTRLPSAQLQVLEAVADSRDVHLMLHCVVPGADGGAGAGNRLLRSWGRESHALLERLGGGERVRVHPPGQLEPRSLLQALQADVRADRRPPGVPLPGQQDGRLAVDVHDRSVSVHSCHGRARQVEVLREAILHRLAADATLEPRDVIIMCPDVETFAPLIEASFGAATESEDATRTLRVRIADRSIRQTNPVLAVISRLLELPSSRVSATDVLDLADMDPVRRRFAFDDDELAQIREWVTQAGIHWGLDAQARAAYKLGQVEAGTWAAGLRRLLLGVAFAGDGHTLFQDVLPTGAVASGEIDLAGRFAELVDRLDAALASLSGAQSVAQWSAALSAAADALSATADQDAWQRRELDQILAEAVQAAPDGGAGQLALPDLRALLGHRLEGRPTRANFRTGHVTVCTLTPMRSVPHRIVCLLGLDDGVFPRQSRHDGDDLLLEDPHPGDRDPRAEDRQLLLDALLAAQDALIITYTGHDERTNAPRPPAVPVGELLDAIDATARPAEGSRARELVLVSHPLQPFDPRNFLGGQGPSPAGDGPWSFDRAALEGARAFTGLRHAPPPFLDGPLPDGDPEDAVALDDLVRFVERPARAFLRQRLGISLWREEDEVADSLPIDLDHLQRWGVGQRLLEALLAGVDVQSAQRAEYARGTLPPGLLGEPVIREILPTAKLLARHALAYAGGWEPRTLETNLVLDDGLRLTGTVSGVRGNVLLSVSYSRLSARHRLAAWVRLLALSAAHPELPLESVTVGRAPGRAQDGPAAVVARISQLGGDPATRGASARSELAALIALRRRGLLEPLPLPCLTAAAYATAELQSGGDAWAAANKVWESSFDFDGEDREPEHQLVFSQGLDMSAMAPLAVALWKPLLGREVLERV